MNLRVVTHGSGRDLALVHGWGLGAGVWNGVVDALAARHRVHLVSLPGYDGAREESAENPAADSVSAPTADPTADGGNGGNGDDGADFATTAAALAAALPAGTTLCGWSLGGMLALAATAAAPGHFARLALVGSTPSFVTREGWPHGQPPSLLDSFAANVAADTAKTLARFVMLFAQGDAAARQVARALAPLVAGPLPSAATLLRGLDWLRERDLRPALAPLAQSAQLAQHPLPVLVLHGTHDPLMPFAAAEAMAARLPRARLEAFAGVAHAPFVSDPTRFCALLTAFCDEPA